MTALKLLGRLLITLALLGALIVLVVGALKGGRWREMAEAISGMMSVTVSLLFVIGVIRRRQENIQEAFMRLVRK